MRLSLLAAIAAAAIAVSYGSAQAQQPLPSSNAQIQFADLRSGPAGNTWSVEPVRHWRRYWGPRTSYYYAPYNYGYPYAYPSYSYSYGYPAYSYGYPGGYYESYGYYAPPFRSYYRPYYGGYYRGPRVYFGLGF